MNIPPFAFRQRNSDIIWKIFIHLEHYHKGNDEQKKGSDGYHKLGCDVLYGRFTHILGFYTTGDGHAVKKKETQMTTRSLSARISKQRKEKKLFLL